MTSGTTGVLEVEAHGLQVLDGVTKAPQEEAPEIEAPGTEAPETEAHVLQARANVTATRDVKT